MSPDLYKKRVNVPSPFPGGDGYLLSNDYWGDDHFMVIEDSYIEFTRKNEAQKSLALTSEWLESRPMLKEIATLSYLSSNCHREANEFAVVSKAPNVTYKRHASLDSKIKTLGDYRRLEFGDTMFYLFLIASKLNITMDYPIQKAPPTKDIEELEDSRWEEDISTEHLLSLCIYFIDRNINKTIARDLVQYTLDVGFRYIAWHHHLPPSYPDKASREIMVYDKNQWDMNIILKKTALKNTKQLPREFFMNEYSPFENANLALDYLREARQNHKLKTIRKRLKHEGSSKLKEIVATV